MMNEAKHSLTVLLHDVVAGHLRLIEGKLSFRYSPEYLAHPSAQTLSFSLPLQTHPFDEQRSKAFFGGLLPEGKLRTLLSKQFGVSKQNDFALLREIGGECAGAVSLVVPGLAKTQVAQNDINWLTAQELSELIEHLPQRPMMAGHDGLRLSLAGAQDKLPVVVYESPSSEARVLVGLPVANQPSTFILKPRIVNLGDSVSNELFCLNLAHAIGINAARAVTIRTATSTVLAVKRYDRVISAAQQAGLDTLEQTETYTRLHQEDFCQALGIESGKKYQAEDGPSLSDCFKLVRQASSNSGTSILSLLDYVLFNTLVGNHDAHGKNFSLLYKKGKTELAPLYDCLSTAIYPNLTSKMAMSIGGKYTFSELHAKHWQQFARDADLSVALTKNRLSRLAQSLPLAARQLQRGNDLPLSNAKVTEQICQLIEQRCALTLERLKKA